MVVREALACLTPVVTVDAGDVRQVLSGYRIATSSTDVPRRWPRRCSRLLNADRHPAWRERAAEYSRAFVTQNLLSLYADVLA